MTIPTFTSIKSMVTNDFWRKLIALLLAIACWLGIRLGEEKGEDSVTLTATIKSRDARIYVENPPQIRLKYSRSKNDSFNAGDFSFELDPLSMLGRLKAPEPCGTVPDSRRLKVTYSTEPLKDCIKMPRGTAITDISPKDIIIEYDECITVQRPVRLTHRGVLEEGYTFKLESSMVSIYGPSEIVNKIQDLTAEAITLSKARHESFSVEVPVIAPSNVQVIPDKISVKVIIENTNLIGEQKFQDIRLNVLYRQSNKLRLANPLPDFVEAIVRGRKSLFEEMKKNGETLQAYVDLSQYGQPGTYRTDVKLMNIPDPRGIHEVVWTSPGQLTVELEAFNEFSDENAMMNVSYNDIRLLALCGHDSDLTLAKPLPKTIAATIRARKSTFDSMLQNSETFTAYVDLSPYTQPGIYDNVKVHILAPPGEIGLINEVEIKPGEIQLTLERNDSRLLNMPPPDGVKPAAVTLDDLAREPKGQP